jgi:hypothetical protein
MCVSGPGIKLTLATLEVIHMATKTKPKETDSSIQLLIATKCSSISGRSEIRYGIGVNHNKEIVVMLINSSGGGQINNAPIAFADILKLLENYSGGGSFTSRVFEPLFPDVSSNNCGFTMAVALKEKLVKPQEGKRKFTYNNPTVFLAKVDKLIAAKASMPSSRRKTKATAQS